MSVLRRAADAIGAGLFALLFGAVFLQVVLRFLLDAPAAWTEELATIAYVWVIFWSAAFCLRLREHVAVDFLEGRLPPRAARWAHACGLGLLAAAFAWALPGIADYLRFMLRERTPVLDWPLGAVYAVFLAFAVMVVVRAVLAIARPESAGGSGKGA